jgi:hypothetical protein
MGAGPGKEVDVVSTFTDLLAAQLELQRESFDLDPATLEDEARAEFIRWNVLALEDELHEALQEVRWKPWAVRQGEWVDRDAYVGELVDALHFLLNLFLTADVSVGEVERRYLAKREVNAERQQAADGYDSVSTKDEAGRAEDEPHQQAIIDEHLRRQRDNDNV